MATAEELVGDKDIKIQNEVLKTHRDGI